MSRHAEQLVKRTTSAQCPSFDFAGAWQNELGSTMILSVDGDGTVRGEYVSAVSDGGGATPPYPLFGTTADDLISFTVNWGSEITTWIGHGVIGKHDRAEILTLWQLVKCVPDIQEPKTQWKAIMAGSDVFFRPKA
jgi:hypothetical protein